MSKSASKRQECNGAQNDDRPRDCECESPDDELLCFTCYLAGFESPNPAAGDDETDDGSVMFPDATPVEGEDGRHDVETPGDAATNPVLLLETAESTIEQLEGRDGDDAARIDVLEGHRDALVDAMMAA